MATRIRIRKDVLSKPLLETDQARLIEIFEAGKLTAVLCLEFGSGLHMLTTKADPDWEAMLIRLGYLDVKASPKDFIAGIGK